MPRGRRINFSCLIWLTQIVAPICLRHRLKKDPTDPVGGPAANERVRKAVEQAIEKFQ